MRAGGGERERDGGERHGAHTYICARPYTLHVHYAELMGVIEGQLRNLLRSLQR